MALRAFVKNSFLGLVTVVCRLASSFFLTKIVAWYFGPAGLAQLAHFQNLLTFFTLIPNDGINRGTISYLASQTPDSVAYRRYFKAGLLLTALTFAATAVIVILARRALLAHFPADFSGRLLFLTGALLLVLQSFFNAVLLAQQRTLAVAIGNGLTAILVILYAGLAFQKLLLPQFLIGYLLVMGSSVFYFYFFSVKILPRAWLRQTPLAEKDLKQLGKFMLMALSVLLFSKGMEFYVRDYMIRHFTIYQAGLWQGVVRISDSYTAVYAAVLAFAFYPKAAALATNAAQLQVFVRAILKLVIPVVLLGLGLVYVTREYIISGLLSAQFLAAQRLLPFQLLGDFFKLLSWLLTNSLVAQGKVGVITLFEGLSAAAYLGFFYFFTQQFGLAGSTMAHATNYVFFLALNVFYFRKLLFR